MPIAEFNLATIATMDDGLIAAAFDAELKRAVLDCEDRPDTTGVRTVTLKVSLKPTTANNKGLVECIGCESEFAIDSKVPKKNSRRYDTRMRKGGKLVYSESSPEEFEQTTFEDLDGDGRVRR